VLCLGCMVELPQSASLCRQTDPHQSVHAPNMHLHRPLQTSAWVRWTRLPLINASAPCLPHRPPPDPACSCLAEWDPVCDAAGTTWTNGCNAHCVRAPLPYKQGPCWSCKACPKAYEPTCAPDAFSYGNTCYAFCAAKPSEKKGPFLGGLCPPPGAPAGLGERT
jgi:hypothetical protein